MRKLKCLFIFLSLWIGLPLAVHGAPAGKITHVEGRVDITGMGETARPAVLGGTVEIGDIIRSKSDSKAEIALSDGSILRLAAQTRVQISEFALGETGGKGILKLFRGKIQSIVKKISNRIFDFQSGNRFEVHTPTAVVGVRGTHFFSYHIKGMSGAFFKEGKGYVFSVNRADSVRDIHAGQVMLAMSPDIPPLIKPATDAEIREHLKSTSPSKRPKEDGRPEGLEAKDGFKKKFHGKAHPPRGHHAVKETFSQKDRSPFEEGPPKGDLFREDHAPDEKFSGWKPSADGHIPLEREGHGGDLFREGHAPDGNFSEWKPSPDAPPHFEGEFPEWKPLQGEYRPPSEHGFSDMEPPDTHHLFDMEPPPDTHCGEERPISEIFSEDTCLKLIFETDISTKLFHALPSEDSEVFSITKIGSMEGTLKGLSPLWEASEQKPAHLCMEGKYLAEAMFNQIPNPIWSSDIISAWEIDNGGSLEGFAGGMGTDGIFDGRYLGIYADPSGEAGILKGHLKGSFYPSGDFEFTGKMFPVPILSVTGFPPERLGENLNICQSDFDDLDINGQFFNADGSLAGNISLNEMYGTRMNIDGESWGIASFLIGGTYEGFEREKDEDHWQLSFDGWEKNNNVRWMKELDGFRWSDSIVSALGHSAWVDLEQAVTGVSGGQLIGTFDPNEHTWQAVEMWTSVDTPQFMEMASSETGREQLSSLNIPCIEVGRANLSGSSETLDVQMNDAVFFSYSTGETPRIWAATDVGGHFRAIPEAGHTVNLNGNGLNADFTVNKWENNTWNADMNGNGTIQRADISGTTDIRFKGAAAGAYTGVSAGEFTGTASGTADLQ